MGIKSKIFISLLGWLVLLAVGPLSCGSDESNVPQQSFTVSAVGQFVAANNGVELTAFDSPVSCTVICDVFLQTSAPDVEQINQKVVVTDQIFCDAEGLPLNGQEIVFYENEAVTSNEGEALRLIASCKNQVANSLDFFAEFECSDVFFPTPGSQNELSCLLKKLDNPVTRSQVCDNIDITFALGFLLACRPSDAETQPSGDGDGDSDGDDEEPGLSLVQRICGAIEGLEDPTQVIIALETAFRCPARCGNGALDRISGLFGLESGEDSTAADEVCDPSAEPDGCDEFFGCNATCDECVPLELCGNGVCDVDLPKDVGPSENRDNCPQDCSCGDGVIDEFEICDFEDGNLEMPFGCEPAENFRCLGPGETVGDFSECRCLPLVEVRCSDRIDNDLDGKTDCFDEECFDDPFCQSETICADRLDNDADGLTDCDDPDCEFDGKCRELICDDRLDNDADLLTDCDDPDCAEDPACGDVCGDGAITGGEQCEQQSDCAKDTICFFCQCIPQDLKCPEPLHVDCVTAIETCNNFGDGCTDLDKACDKVSATLGEGAGLCDARAGPLGCCVLELNPPPACGPDDVLGIEDGCIDDSFCEADASCNPDTCRCEGAFCRENPGDTLDTACGLADFFIEGPGCANSGTFCNTETNCCECDGTCDHPKAYCAPLSATILDLGIGGDCDAGTGPGTGITDTGECDPDNPCAADCTGHSACDVKDACGDGVAQSSLDEICDPGDGGSIPPDDANCPGLCNPDCTCGRVPR